ncbi:gas vesicle accessory protein GvpU [Pseudanabaena galeata UHCC 0370]|uniref:Gas vesicle accessory protein GvpU n=1 Tax=Pseudanabaena galeata UHCC 0370 TaxID=3110310 RepID=A0ABU5TGL3_9CYAN|nr:gas vesicle accessory protein GvpU [Pseudanabaena galeata]MEA5477406.1 gas vesicle accessory protein GvpU [Pseudanabaena galeata UHCC 0370]
MTNETINQDPFPKAAQTDWFLQSLVNMANNQSLEISITLQVSGMLVSGDIVGGKTYFEGVGEEFSSTFVNHPETAESIKDSFSKMGERYVQTDETEVQPLPQFVHLKNARFFHTSGSPIPSNRSVFWRGRISEVGGFFLGSLSA